MKHGFLRLDDCFQERQFRLGKLPIVAYISGENDSQFLPYTFVGLFNIDSNFSYQSIENIEILNKFH